MTVDLICADSWLCNAGDVASALATANGLAERGVPVCRVPDYRGRQTIIGGGDLLGAGPNADLFCPRGPHSLNAVSVRADPGDLSYLQDYRYLSFRDHTSVEKAGLTNVHVVPCPTVLLSPLPWNVACAVPRWGHLQHHRPKNYVVIHARAELSGLANGCPDAVIAVEPAPYCWHPWEAKGWRLPMTHSPELILTVIAGAKAVITLSLHLSILACAVGTPFCVPLRGNPQQSAKVAAYWQRAGLPEVVYDGDRPVRHALRLQKRIGQVRKTEMVAAKGHLDRLAAAIAPA
ncbi:polysaccharide pyruvyl transferase family protein [Planctomicrobium sp. SH661]|uniref:polysaccharide pyruvyl transferase family protein n=1 Tax=Planctomicrobium sp. SH661 TaxID=3448124 RepID=UPI003F5B9780